MFLLNRFLGVDESTDDSIIRIIRKIPPLTLKTNETGIGIMLI